MVIVFSIALLSFKDKLCETGLMHLESQYLLSVTFIDYSWQEHFFLHPICKGHLNNRSPKKTQELVIKISLWSKYVSWQTNWSITQGKNTWSYWIVLLVRFQMWNHISYMIWISRSHRRHHKWSALPRVTAFTCVVHHGVRAVIWLSWCKSGVFTLSKPPADRPVDVWPSQQECDEPPPAVVWLFHSRSFNSPKRDEQHLCLTELT